MMKPSPGSCRRCCSRSSGPAPVSALPIAEALSEWDALHNVSQGGWTMQSDAGDLVKQLTGELRNFEDIARFLIGHFGDSPKLRGIDIYGGTVPLSGVMGGD